MLNILSFTKFSKKIEALVANSCPEAKITYVKEKEAAPYLAEADIIIGFGGKLQWKNILPLATKCRWVHTLSAGVDRLTSQPDFVASDTILTNSRGIHGVPMGEHVLGIILGFSRCLYTAYEQQKRHEWKNIPGTDEIAGKTAVIVGLGAVGTGIAAKLKAMDMRVIGVKQHLAPWENIDHVYGPDELDKALAEGDYIIASLPVTPATENLFDFACFQKMKPTAVFLNVSRGETVVEEDLALALKEKVIAGAALDVFRKEPLPEDSPLWEAPNLIITPHNSSISPLYLERTMKIFAENLKVFPMAEKMQNVVDKVRGY